MKFPWRKQQERLEEKCKAARTEKLGSMMEIIPYEACKKCPDYVQYGAAHYCTGPKYNKDK